MNCRQYFYSADLKRTTSCWRDDGVWADTKKGLVQHSGSRPICNCVRPKTKVSKTHFNGKSFVFDSVLQGENRFFFLCDQKYRFLYHEYVISKQESKVLIWLIESFSSSVKKKSWFEVELHSDLDHLSHADWFKILILPLINLGNSGKLFSPIFSLCWLKSCSILCEHGL